MVPLQTCFTACLGLKKIPLLLAHPYPWAAAPRSDTGARSKYRPPSRPIPNSTTMADTVAYSLLVCRKPAAVLAGSPTYDEGMKVAEFLPTKFL